MMDRYLMNHSLFVIERINKNKTAYQKQASAPYLILCLCFNHLLQANIGIGICNIGSMSISRIGGEIEPSLFVM